MICKMKNFYILLAFLLITTAFLKAVSIYCFIKYRAKQKKLLPLYDASNKTIYIKIYFKNGK